MSVVLVRKTPRTEYDYTWETSCDTCGSVMRQVTFTSPEPPLYENQCADCLRKEFAAIGSVLPDDWPPRGRL